jgi:hypothetical protein
MSGIINVKGRRIDQVKLRAHLKTIDIEDCFHEETEDEDEYWESPITGERFENVNQLNGHIGAYLRTPNRKDPTEPSRAGYVRALRAGMQPTEEQKAAHAKYAARRRAVSKGEVFEPDRPRPTFSN